MNNYTSKILWTEKTFKIYSRLPEGSIGELDINGVKRTELTRINNERKVHLYADVPTGYFKVRIECKKIEDGARYNVKSAEKFCDKCNINRKEKCEGKSLTLTEKKKVNGTDAEAKWLPNFRIKYICGEIIDLENIIERTELHRKGKKNKYALLTNATHDALETHDMLANEANNERDERGHLIAASFGGPNCHFNLVLQPVEVNQHRIEKNLVNITGCYYEVEKQVRQAIRDVDPRSKISRAFMRVDLHYRDDGVIPDWFNVAVYRYDGSAAAPLKKNILVRNDEKDKGIGVANWRYRMGK